MAGHVFISHGSDNRDEANALCAYIEGHGVKAWIAPRDVRPGIDYSEALQAAIEDCVAFVVLVTEMANTSPYVRAETEMAFSNSKPLFPVRLTDIKPAPGLAFFLKIRHWTDAFGKERAASLDRLALELKTLSGIEPAAAAAPEPPPAAPAPPPLPGGGGVSKRAMIVAAAIAALAAAILVVIVMRQAPARAVDDDPFFRGATSGPGTPDRDGDGGGQSGEPADLGGILDTDAEANAAIGAFDDGNANALAEIRNLLEAELDQQQQQQSAPSPPED